MLRKLLQTWDRPHLSKRHVNVELQRSSYYPGEVLRGAVQLDLSKPTCVVGLDVQLHGYELTYAGTSIRPELDPEVMFTTYCHKCIALLGDVPKKMTRAYERACERRTSERRRQRQSDFDDNGVIVEQQDEEERAGGENGWSRRVTAAAEANRRELPSASVKKMIHTSRSPHTPQTQNVGRPGSSCMTQPSSKETSYESTTRTTETMNGNGCSASADHRQYGCTGAVGGCACKDNESDCWSETSMDGNNNNTSNDLVSNNTRNRCTSTNRMSSSGVRSGSIVIVRQDSKDSLMCLLPGTYNYPFEVQLPDVLPPSFHVKTNDGVNATSQMVYNVTVTLRLRHSRRKFSQKVFTVKPLPVQLQRWYALQRKMAGRAESGENEVAGVVLATEAQTALAPAAAEKQPITQHYSDMVRHGWVANKEDEGDYSRCVWQSSGHGLCSSASLSRSVFTSAAPLCPSALPRNYPSTARTGSGQHIEHDAKAGTRSPHTKRYMIVHVPKRDIPGRVAQTISAPPTQQQRSGAKQANVQPCMSHREAVNKSCLQSETNRSDSCAGNRAPQASHSYCRVSIMDRFDQCELSEPHQVNPPIHHQGTLGEVLSSATHRPSLGARYQEAYLTQAITAESKSSGYTDYGRNGALHVRPLSFDTWNESVTEEMGGMHRAPTTLPSTAATVSQQPQQTMAMMPRILTASRLGPSACGESSLPSASCGQSLSPDRTALNCCVPVTVNEPVMRDNQASNTHADGVEDDEEDACGGIDADPLGRDAHLYFSPHEMSDSGSKRNIGDLSNTNIISNASDAASKMLLRSLSLPYSTTNCVCAFTACPRTALFERQHLRLRVWLSTRVLIPGYTPLRVCCKLDRVHKALRIHKITVQLATYTRVYMSDGCYPSKRKLCGYEWIVPNRCVNDVPYWSTTLQVPSNAYWTLFTRGHSSYTLLKVHVHYKGMLFQQHLSFAVEVMLVHSIDTQNQSRRLKQWTSYFDEKEAEVGCYMPPSRMPAPRVVTLQSIEGGANSSHSLSALCDAMSMSLRPAHAESASLFLAAKKKWNETSGSDATDYKIQRLHREGSVCNFDTALYLPQNGLSSENNTDEGSLARINPLTWC